MAAWLARAPASLTAFQFLPQSHRSQLKVAPTNQAFLGWKVDCPSVCW
jgi:hypothetical protein